MTGRSKPQKLMRKAEALFLEAYALGKTNFGAEHALTLEAGNDPADLYETWGKPEKAAAYRTRK